MDSPNNTNKLQPVLITVDVCDGSFDSGGRSARFDDLMGTLPGLCDLLNNVISEHTGTKKLPVTWFLRADEQVRRVVGTVDGLYTGWRDFWETIESNGGEVGWHPHLFVKENGRWYPARDGIMLRDLADRAWSEMQGNSGGWKPQSCRMGEALCSNELMRFLSEVGFTVDSSALPGRCRADKDRWFDWEVSPEIPYHPSNSDYRIPAANDDTQLDILEIPFTMAEIRASYDAADTQVSRYLDLSYDPDVFGPAVVKKIDRTCPLVMVIHPMQATGAEIPSGGLVQGGLEIIKRNLVTIFSSIVDAGNVPKLLTMRDFISYV